MPHQSQARPMLEAGSANAVIEQLALYKQA